MLCQYHALPTRILQVSSNSVPSPMKKLPEAHGRFAIAPTLVAAIGSLALISVGSILALQFYSSTQLVGNLGSRLVARNLQILELALSRHLDAAVEQADFVREALQDGAFEISNDNGFPEFVAGTLASAPQINGIIVATPDNKAVWAARTRSGAVPEPQWVDFTDDTQTMAIAVETKTHKFPYWGAPAYVETLKQTVLNYRVPLWQGEEFRGFIAIGIGTTALAQLASEFSEPPYSTIFMLHGQDHVLAEPGLQDRSEGLSLSQPLLPISTSTNPILSALAGAVPFSRAGLVAPEDSRMSQLTSGDEDYLVITKTLSGYGTPSPIIGAYSSMRAVDEPLRLLQRSLLAGFLLLVLSTGLAVILSRVISRPIRRSSREAAKIATLDFDRIDPVSGSFLREVDDLATSFNIMLEGVKSFGRYVPRGLVRRLIQEHRVGAGSEERDLTVMFTDIAGFTATCEGMSASEVAEFINRHLTIVADCIETEGGTIDKYIGDAVMAFWGAPDHIDDAPARACRAALAIRTAIIRDNEERIAAGKPAVRMRIGIHRGPLIVGDIGAPQRINYTVVGDVVNAAQRLEGLGKEIDPNADVIVLASAETIRDTEFADNATHEGRHAVKGKQQQLDVFRL